VNRPRNNRAELREPFSEAAGWGDAIGALRFLDARQHGWPLFLISRRPFVRRTIVGRLAGSDSLHTSNPLCPVSCMP
jgi:hypothetical protein